MVQYNTIQQRLCSCVFDCNGGGQLRGLVLRAWRVVGIVEGDGVVGVGGVVEVMGCDGVDGIDGVLDLGTGAWSRLKNLP